MEVIFCELTRRIISMTEESREDDVRYVENLSIEDVDSYTEELIDVIKEEFAKEDYNKDYVIEVLTEIADINELYEIQELLEKPIRPENGVMYCPQCKEVIKLEDDEFYVCECGWTTNY